MTFTIPAWIIYTICGIGAIGLIIAVSFYAYLGWMVSKHIGPPQW